MVGLVGEPFEELGEVASGEPPLEGLGGLLVATLERCQAGLDLGEIGEVVRSEHLALHDGEVDLSIPG